MTTVNTRVKDMFGNIIQAGDYISYPGRQGSSIWNRVAKVKKIRYRKSYLNYQDTLELGGTNTPVIDVVTALETYSDKPAELKNVTVSEFHRAIVLPKAYVQNDPRFTQLLEV